MPENKAEELIRSAINRGETSLDLSNLGLVNIPGSVIELKDKLSDLTLGSGIPGLAGDKINRVEDLSVLKEFRDLKRLRLQGLKSLSAACLPELTQLEWLDISFTDLTYSDDVAQLSKLKYLNMERCGLTRLHSKNPLPVLKKINFVKWKMRIF